MSTITERWQNTKQQAAEAARSCGRAPDDVMVMAVSKTFPLAAVEEAWQAGARHFGENYVQEGVDKAEAFHPEGLIWHYIGPLQSNKTRAVATHFDWVHTIDRLKIARRLSEQRPADLAPLQVCLQINISADPNKAGVSPADAEALAAEVSPLPNLTLRGLMTIPAADLPLETLQQQFAAMHELFKRLQKRWPQMDTLSMGMTDDMATAIAAGSTCVRVGRAIFGERPRKTSTD